MALRRAADRLQPPLLRLGKVPYGGEHILICLSGALQRQGDPHRGPDGRCLLYSEFTALYVESPTAQDMDEKAWAGFGRTSAWRRIPGPRSPLVYGDDLASKSSEYAKAGGVTKVVIGRSGGRRTLVHPQRNLADQLMELSPTWTFTSSRTASPLFPSPGSQGEVPGLPCPTCFKTAAVVAFCSMVGLFSTGLAWGCQHHHRLHFRGAHHLPTHLWPDVRGLASLVSVVLFNYLFTQPRFTFRAYDAGYPVTF